MLKIKISLEIFHSFLIISLYFLKILSIISQKLSIISQKTLYNLSKNSLHILSFNLSLYSHSIIKIILTHDHLGMNFTFVLVYHHFDKNFSAKMMITKGICNKYCKKARGLEPSLSITLRKVPLPNKVLLLTLYQHLFYSCYISYL